jgi:competence protein ComEA
VREAKDTDDVVAARMRALHDGGPAAPADRDGLAGRGGPLRWADIIPAWSEVDGSEQFGGPEEFSGSGGEGRGLPGGPGTAGGVPMPAGDVTGPGVGAAVPERLAPSFDERYAWKAEDPALPGKGAFDGDPGGSRKWLHALDPGRPGVRALAAVAVVVVLVAAFLAWRARPRVEPVVPDLPPVSAASTAAAAPGATAVRSAPAEVVVAVGGKVRKPGLVRLAPGARVADALTAAGGAEPGVDVAGLNLARKVTDGELIMVGASPPPGVTTPPGPVTSGAPGGLINLNTATLAELDTLPGVGPVLAQRILDARDAQGGFRAVTDLRKVDGIGDSRYEQLKDLVTV